MPRFQGLMNPSATFFMRLITRQSNYFSRQIRGAGRRWGRPGAKINSLIHTYIIVGAFSLFLPYYSIVELLISDGIPKTIRTTTVIRRNIWWVTEADRRQSCQAGTTPMAKPRPSLSICSTSMWLKCISIRYVQRSWLWLVFDPPSFFFHSSFQIQQMSLSSQGSHDGSRLSFDRKSM